jgi:2-polyprenyl-3-methyl-5-hydroxy-6-metoxy-1,4-benzoquinol methylase
MATEYSRLDALGLKSPYALGVMKKVTKYSSTILIPYLQDPILEVGPADGIVTEEIIRAGFLPILLEGSKPLCESLLKQFPDTEVVHSLFEDFKPLKKFNTIVMGHVLEHVENPTSLVTHAYELLLDGGAVWAAVPNALSIHRQAAVKMGILKDVYELNATDISVGHRRVFDLKSLCEIFDSSGFKIEKTGGYFLKPISNSQIEETWTEEMVDAFLELGKDIPDVSGEIWVLAIKKAQKVNFYS